MSDDTNAPVSEDWANQGDVWSASKQIKGVTMTEFDEEWKKDFQGLAYLGYLTTVVTIPCHEFLLKTLTVGEKIQVGEIARSHEGSMVYAKSFKSAIVAASLISVDGEPIMTGEQKTSIILQKYRYVVNTWFEPIIDLLYFESAKLELRVNVVLQKLGIISRDEEDKKEEEGDDSSVEE